MKNKLTDLNDYMFAEIEGLGDEEIKGYPMERLTKSYKDGSFGVADQLPVGENSHSFKKILIDKLGAYEEIEEIAGYKLRESIHCMAGEILRLKDELEFYKNNEEEINNG